MELKKELYINQKERLPKKGQQIIAQYEPEFIVVYQSFNQQITDYALKYQKFGGSSYSFGRMSWIKPNFLWMMFRCGWNQKQNQERTLAIWLKISVFENILKQAVFSSYKSEIYENTEQWKSELLNSNVRLQWDPDHNPSGDKIERRAIQIGLKDDSLKEFNDNGILEIQDITNFVKEESKKLNDLDKLIVPIENVLEIKNDYIKKRLMIEL